MSACWAFPLAAWNFYFQNCLSPFLAWANGRGRNLGTYHSLIVCAPAINPGQKWWQIVMEIKSLMQPMRRLEMHSWGVQFFLGGREWEGGRIFFRLIFMCSHHILIWFPSDSPSSQVISHDIPNRTSDLSHMICPKFNSHVYKLKTWATGEHQLFLFCNWRGSKGRN